MRKSVNISKEWKRNKRAITRAFKKASRGGHRSEILRGYIFVPFYNGLLNIPPIISVSRDELRQNTAFKEFENELKECGITIQSINCRPKSTSEEVSPPAHAYIELKR